MTSLSKEDWEKVSKEIVGKTAVYRETGWKFPVTIKNASLSTIAAKVIAGPVCDVLHTFLDYELIIDGQNLLSNLHKLPVDKIGSTVVYSHHIDYVYPHRKNNGNIWCISGRYVFALYFDTDIHTI